MKGKTVIITGGSSGIGRALACVFAHNESQVVISGRNQDTLEKAAVSYPNILPVVADVSIEADCKRLIEQTIKRYGKIDVLINNAGISMRAAFHDTTPEVLRTVMETNFWGAVYCTHYALPHLLQSRGSVVGISSVAGKAGLPGRTGYSASKFALEGFLESLRTENLKRGLHVLVACPGFTASNIRQSALDKDGKAQGESPRNEQRMMSAEKVAGEIYRAVLKRKRDLILTTEGKLTVLIKKFAPSLLDRLIHNQLGKEPGAPF